MLGTLQKCALCNFHVFSMILKTCGLDPSTAFFQMKYFSNPWPFRKSFDRKFKIQNSKTIIPRIPFRSVQLWISNLVRKQKVEKVPISEDLKKVLKSRSLQRKPIWRWLLRPKKIISQTTQVWLFHILVILF